MKYDVAILTEDKFTNQPDLNWYNLQVLLEDEILKSAFCELGLTAERISWSDKSVDWEKVGISIFRTTWDYFDRYPEFFSWFKLNSQKTKFVNSYETVRWNIDKHYLKDLKKRGINIVDTEYQERGSSVNISSYFEVFNSDNFILKPTISGGARHTYKVNRSNCSEIQKKYDKLILEEDFMFQPFQENIVRSGEISLVVINGEYSHSVKKIASNGDFRVQDDHGGIVEYYFANTEEILFAEKVVTLCDELPVYARVDIVRDNNNKLALMELELLEPELFFRFNKPAAKKLALAVQAKYF